MMGLRDQMAQQQAQQQGTLAALLGDIGQGLAQQINPYQVALGATPAYGYFSKPKDYEALPLTFLQSLRNEIDEWLKL